MCELSRDTIKEILAASIEQLRREDGHLLAAKVNERSITHRLAAYLESHLRREIPSHPYHVDCEYNRFGSSHVKRLLDLELKNFQRKSELEQTDGSPVLPDILVHGRGQQEDNLLVVECKLDQRDTLAVARDKRKLELFQLRPFKYRYAAFVDLSKVGNEIDFGPHRVRRAPPGKQAKPQML